MSVFLDDIKGAFRRSDNAHVQMIMVNVIVFVCLLIVEVFSVHIFQHREVYDTVITYLAQPASFMELIYKPWTVITYGFVHQGFWHIIINMLMLFWFGSVITEFLGSRRLVNLYLLGTLAGGLVFALAYNLIPNLKPYSDHTVIVGASAAVYAIVIAAATLLPDYTFFLLILGPVKIKYIALFYILLSFAETIGSNPGGNFAHLGGALLGFIFIRQLKVGNDLGKPLSALFDLFKRINQPKQKIKVSYRNDLFYRDNYRSSQDLPDQEEIDRILDKISISGYASLSKEEKEKLFSASQKK